MLVHEFAQTKVKRPPPEIIRARSYNNFDKVKFSKDIGEAPWSVCEVFDNLDDCYWAWKQIFGEICNKHAPFHEFKVRHQSLPWITPQIRHLISYVTKLFSEQKYQTIKHCGQSIAH